MYCAQLLQITSNVTLSCRSATCAEIWPDLISYLNEHDIIKMFRVF